MIKILNCALTSVLYSHQTKSWKVADFGLATEGTSKLAITTRNGRGTGGYRAPELLAEFSKFTNKVDIWALGCILYELAVGQKAFSDDYAVLNSLSPRSTLQIFPTLSKNLFAHLPECLFEMLEKDPWQRPSVSVLRRLIESYYTILVLQKPGRDWVHPRI